MAPPWSPTLSVKVHLSKMSWEGGVRSVDFEGNCATEPNKVFIGVVVAILERDGSHEEGILHVPLDEETGALLSGVK
tara:strand:- start:98 stop:328 length:231 start_codon:yes stop_codon:yes gene_type:complete